MSKDKTSFVLDDSTEELINNLKAKLGVTSNSAVILRALKLAEIATEVAGDDKSIELVKRGASSPHRTVKMAD